tara:strand:+ start:10242 stop:11105 length:864 start_codon:yes stop_codon:yes gene_type:complete
MISEKLWAHIASALKISEKLLRTSIVAGGSINDTYRVDAENRKYFLKINDDRALKMFELEQKGLALLRQKSVNVPQVYGLVKYQNLGILVMEYLPKGVALKSSSEQLGKMMAELHRSSNFHFGLDYDNYMGALPQSNHQHRNWTAFFIQERLLPQAKLAVDNRQLAKADLNKIEGLSKIIDTIYPEEPVALVHGDFWGGNYLITEDGVPYIFDPAVAYSHRETDLAMTLLFGGFDDAFYSGYNAIYPLEKGWKERATLTNLYPLLIHVNLFGGSYVSQVKAILQQWS